MIWEGENETPRMGAIEKGSPQQRRLGASHTFSHSLSFCMPIAHTQHKSSKQTDMMDENVATSRISFQKTRFCPRVRFKHTDKTDEMTVINQNFGVWASDGQNQVLKPHCLLSGTTQACVCVDSRKVWVSEAVGQSYIKE